MDSYERDYFIYRVCSNQIRCKVGNGLFILSSPDKISLYEAAEVYYETYKQCESEGIITDDDAKDFLIESDKWSEQLQNRIDEFLPKYMENCKLEMLDNFNNKSELEKLREYLRKAEEELLSLFSIRHSLDHLTCHGVASFSKFQYVVSNHCTPECNPNEILGWLNNNQISEKTMRELARTDPWRTLYACSRKSNNDIFSLPSCEFSEEQKRLISWSLVYDSVYESNECPRDEIIQDDDVFDGYLIKRRKKNEIEQTKNEYENKLDKHSNANEVFLTVSDNDPNASVRTKDLKNVSDSLNTETSKAIIKQRLNTIQKSGEQGVSELGFADVKMAIQMQINRGK